MKFDFCIGNPPYQETQENTSDDPVYYAFMDAAYEVADKVELITPARFLFNAGKTPKPWNEKMLYDEHLKVAYYEQDSSKVFSNTDIKGGVAITYRDNSKFFGAVEIFTPFNEVNNIFMKVKSHHDYKSLYEIVVTSFAYHLTDELYKDHPHLKGRLSKGHDYDLKSNLFDKIPEIFTETKPDDIDDYAKILGRESNNRAIKYIKRKYLNDVINFDKYKIFVPKANGTGTFGETLAPSIIQGPQVGATESFLSIGTFDTKNEALHALKYIKTKFARTLLGILKVTQDITPNKWRCIPLQDFTSSSDIDWSESVSDIDKQLYKKYGLSSEEITFIENNVKEME